MNSTAASFHAQPGPDPAAADLRLSFAPEELQCIEAERRLNACQPEHEHEEEEQVQKQEQQAGEETKEQQDVHLSLATAAGQVSATYMAYAAQVGSGQQDDSHSMTGQ